MDVIGLEARGGIGDGGSAIDDIAVQTAGAGPVGNQFEPAVFPRLHGQNRHLTRPVQRNADPRGRRGPQPEAHRAGFLDLGAEGHAVVSVHAAH
jgi:hypothetical protein